MDYNTLVKTVQSYLENDFPATEGSGGLSSQEQVNTFIKQAERRIYNSVLLPVMRKSTTLATVSGNKTLTLPSDWQFTDNIAIINSNRYEVLEGKDLSFTKTAYPDTTFTGVPRFYSVSGEGQYKLTPTPNAAYVVELDYFHYPESIVTATTTWLGDNADMALLYGIMLEAGTFMRLEADSMSVYQARYAEAMDLLKTLGETKRVSDLNRFPQTRKPT